MNKVFEHFSIRSVVVMILVTGCLGLAIADKDFRPTFGRLADIGLGGYLAQLIPKSGVKNEGS